MTNPPKSRTALGTARGQEIIDRWEKESGRTLRTVADVIAVTTGLDD